MTALLVIDVGTTGLRAAVVDDRLRIAARCYHPNPPSSPAAGLVEFDAQRMADLALDAARTVIDEAGVPIDAVGITNQRASTVVWNRRTGRPIAPGLGWQDLRTIGECITAKAEHGWSIAPNQSVTKLSWLLTNGGVDVDSHADLAFGTIDSWIAWTLSEGSVHVSDQTNASATTTGMRAVDGSEWNETVCDAFGIPRTILPDVVDSAGVCGTATALPGAPPIAALIGDQQASLVGQGCIHPGRAKITFGTGGMLDVCTDNTAPEHAARHAAGTYPLPLWSYDGHLAWGVEGIMLSAGSNVDWLRDDLGLIATSEESHDVASGCADSAGVVYVPALLGLGTPAWDYGARGTLLGLTRGSERTHVVRAVLEGIAHRGADLLDAATADTGTAISTVRIDGGMSTNPTFAQALANVSGRPIDVAAVSDSTTIGAAFMAGLGVGVWTSIDDIDTLWRPAETVEPNPQFDRDLARSTWARALERAAGWIPELSALDV
jgi:glycerol kinase